MTEAAITGERQGADAVQTVRGKYLSITSYKQNGTAVATPVWFVDQDGRLLVETDAASGKVKRIRHNPAVLVAACAANGRLRGDQLQLWRNCFPSPQSPGRIA
jgi:PPOX class probable F420-dependent enzyme